MLFQAASKVTEATCSQNASLVGGSDCSIPYFDSFEINLPEALGTEQN
jgi:hypothetical protein